jgi:hypothetical protein
VVVTVVGGRGVLEVGVVVGVVGVVGVGLEEVGGTTVTTNWGGFDVSLLAIFLAAVAAVFSTNEYVPSPVIGTLSVEY